MIILRTKNFNKIAKVLQTEEKGAMNSIAAHFKDAYKNAKKVKVGIF